MDVGGKALGLSCNHSMCINIELERCCCTGWDEKGGWWFPAFLCMCVFVLLFYFKSGFLGLQNERVYVGFEVL